MSGDAAEPTEVVASAEDIDEDEEEWVTVTHKPARTSAILAAVAAGVAVLASATSLLAMAVGVFGLLGIVGGLFALESRRAVAVGTGVVFVGVVLSGVLGRPSVLLVVGALAAVLSFDFGENAFGVGNQLTAETDTTRGELVHAAASVIVGILVVGVGYAVYATGIEGLSYGSLSFILFGGLLIVWGIRT